MKKERTFVKQIISLFVIFAGLMFGQSAPNFTISAGTDPVTKRYCNDQTNAGSIYTLIQNPTNGFSGTYVCLQTGGGTIPTFGWVPFQNQSSTATTGTL